MTKGTKIFLMAVVAVVAFLIGFWVCSWVYIVSDRKLITKIDTLTTSCDKALNKITQEWERIE